MRKYSARCEYNFVSSEGREDKSNRLLTAMRWDNKIIDNKLIHIEHYGSFCNLYGSFHRMHNVGWWTSKQVIAQMKQHGKAEFS